MRRSTRSTATAPRETTAGGTSVGLRAIDERRAPRGADRDEKAAARSRRRFARRQWRRRWLAWKPVLVLTLAVLLGVGGVWLVCFSSVLAVEKVSVDGLDTVPASEVRTLADVDRGTPLALVDVDAIRTRVGALAPVRSVEVHRRWPHTLQVVVEERLPVAVVRIGQQLRSLDADGVVFGSYDKAPAGLPLIDSTEGTSSDALREAATVVAALPSALAGRVDHAEVISVDQVSLVLRDGRRVEWGSADDSDLKAQVLAALLAEKGTTYDVSVPGQPTVAG